MKDEIYTITTNSASQTKKIARLLGQEIGASKSSMPFVIGLRGDLGAGKTTFIKGFAKGLGVSETVSSPTFILIAKHIGKSKILYHIDPCRLDNPKKNLPELKELFSEKNAVIAIEWAERVDKFLPEGTIWIMLKYKGRQKRVIAISVKDKTQSVKLQLKT